MNMTTADLSPCGRYRYALTRTWNLALPRVCWVMLNPSTADATKDDPTIRRVLGFSRSWGFGSLEVVSLFAWRATDPKGLLRACDPIGPENDAHIHTAAQRATKVLAAWGSHALGSRWDRVNAILSSVVEITWCLGRTKEGHPRHPLYVRGDTLPEVWGTCR